MQSLYNATVSTNAVELKKKKRQPTCETSVEIRCQILGQTNRPQTSRTTAAKHSFSHTLERTQHSSVPISLGLFGFDVHRYGISARTESGWAYLPCNNAVLISSHSAHWNMLFTALPSRLGWENVNFHRHISKNKHVGGAVFFSEKQWPDHLKIK